MLKAFRADIGKFGNRVSELGVPGAMGYFIHAMKWRTHTYMDRHYDRNHNVRTSSHAYSWDLDMRSEGDDIGEEEPMYLPTSTAAFRQIMSRLPDELSDFSFVDYGSGKGRTLLLAAEYNFKRIVGVEFASELHDDAIANIASYDNPAARCDNMVSELVDATLYDPPDGPCVLYFFNPFEEEVMRKVLARIRQSFHDRPRKMYLAYYKPKFPEIFSQHDFLREVTRSKTLFSLLNPYGLAMYETRDFSSNGEIVS